MQTSREGQVKSALCQSKKYLGHLELLNNNILVPLVNFLHSNFPSWEENAFPSLFFNELRYHDKLSSHDKREKPLNLLVQESVLKLKPKIVNLLQSFGIILQLL